jgi:NTP pyrophosphatase (non-canonical NTP hydrolase)
MIYYIYHIPGKKIGVTRDLNKRVTEQQGYEPHEYEILGRYTDIRGAAEKELYYQRIYGYPVDIVPYDKLNCNKNKLNMNINITEQTTTFPCPINKLKGQLMDSIGMNWKTDHGDCRITKKSIDWIMKNIQISRYNSERCYVYNKAMARWFDNNDAHDQYNGQCRSGALSPAGVQERCKKDCACSAPTQFDLIRDWADERGLYENGDTKTQALKLVEEVGETCRAILKEDYEEVVDGIGDCVVVLTNLAELQGVSIEECIEAAYNEIKNRKGKMANGTYVKQ